MTQGIFTAASGIRANQTAIDVISNNISNVNTVAFKSAKANFATTFLRTISGGSKPSLTRGGFNPMQIGTGTTLSEIAVNHGQGGATFTGRVTDMLISGEGYFVTQDLSGLSPSGVKTAFTRAGNFTLDAAGYLVNYQGDRLVGTSQIEGASPATIDNVKIPTQLKIAKYLNASGTTIATALGVKDSPNVEFNNYATANAIAATSTVYENADLVNFSVGLTGAIIANYSNGDKLTVRANPDTTTNSMELNHLTNQGGNFTGVNATNASGRVGQLGGVYQLIAPSTGGGNPMAGSTLQLQAVTFTNKNGLESIAGNTFLAGANVGEVYYGIPGFGSRGAIQTGSLESSNVDMALEFSNLVVAQRGLEANSRIISTQSEVLQSIINAVG
jgi:flagellar hook protein FlgE